MRSSALGVAGYILSQERFHLPNWVPVVGSDFYKLNVEFQTGQAVVPGQGQTVNIAGVKVGDVQSVHLKNGVAVVSVNMDKKYAPVYRNAHVLLRPKTGLKDMYLALDPGTKDAGALPERRHDPGGEHAARREPRRGPRRRSTPTRATTCRSC